MDEYQRFEQWLLKNGAFFEKLELREYPSSNVDEGLGDDNNDTNESMTNPMIDIDEQEEKKEGLMELDKVDDEYDNDTNNNDPNTTTTTTSSSSSSSSIRGVFCKTSITPNTVCMSVPRKCLITVEMGQETPIGQQILRANLDLDAPKHIFLMIFILQDRLNTQSFFKPYYDVLPKELSMPIFWSEDDLNFLKGSYLLQQVMDRIDAIEEDYQSICDICTNFSTNIATLDEFKWARMCVCSRNFGLQIDGIRTSAMVPYADMLNHYRPRETKWTFDDDQQAFTITTLQPMQGGCEIYDSYGQKCNHRFLLNYGFAIERNIEMDGFCPNEVPIEIELDDCDEIYEDKLEFWCREDAPTCKRVRVCVSNNENTKTLFSLLRVVVADANEFPVLLHGIGGTTFSTTTATATNSTTATTTTTTSPSLKNNDSSSPSDTATTEINNNPSTNSAKTSLGTIRHPHHVGGNNRHSPHFRSTSTTMTTATTTKQGSGGSTATTTTTNKSVFVPMGVGYRTSRDVRFPISIRNEIAMLQKLLSIVRYNLSQYPTTIEQDREALGRNNNTNITTTITTNSNNSGGAKTTTNKNKHDISPSSNQLSNSNHKKDNNNESVNSRNDQTLNESSSTTSTSPYDNITLPPFSNRRHAVIQVMGEKEVLHYYEDLALTGIDVLNKWMNHHHNKNSNIEEQQQPQDVLSSSLSQDDHKTKNDEEASTGTSVLGDTGSRSSNNNNSHTTTTERIDTTIIKSLEQDGKHAQIIKYCTDLMRSLRGLSSSSTIRHGHHHSHRSQS